MIQVQAPDGSIVEFPDGTPDDVMANAMRQTFGGPQAPQPAAPQQAAPDTSMWGQIGGAVRSALQADPLAGIRRSVGDAALGVGERLGGAANDIVRGVADTVTFGLADEMSAKLSSSMGMGDYDRNLEYQRRQTKEAQDRAGLAGTAASLATGMRGAAAVAGAGVPVLSSLAGGAPQSAGILTRMGVGAAAGGLGGGAYGFGSGEGSFENRLESAATGGAIGAAVGGAVPALVSGAGAAYRNVMDRRANSQIARDAGLRPEIADTLARTMANDGSLGSVGMTNMRRAGDSAMLADSGPNSRQLLDTAIQRGGPGATLARERIDARVSKGSRDVVRALNETLGQPEGIGSAQRSIRDAARPELNRIWDEAYQQPIDYSSDAGKKVEDIFNRMPPSMTRRAIQQANDLIRWEGRPVQILADIADDGSVKFREMPNVIQADYVKKGLDRIVQDGTDELTGKLNSEALLASRVARELRTAVGEAVPVYKQALETSADPLSREAAVRLGSRVLSPSMTMDQVKLSTAGMSEPERLAAAQGIRSQIDNSMANVSRALTDTNVDAREAIKALKDLSSRANKQKVASVIGDEKAAKLFEELDRAATSFELRSALADNSKTYTRMAMDRTISEMSEPNIIQRTLEGEPIKAGKRLVQLLTQQTPEKRIAKQDQIYSDLARLLTSPPETAIKAAQALDKYAETKVTNSFKVSDLLELLRPAPAASYGVSSALIPDDRK